MKRFEDCGVCVPELLLPAQKKLSSWSVIACDQYTQDSEYWNKVADCVADRPSTLNLILPELYLQSPDCEERIQKIRSTMNQYLSDGTFDSPAEECMYIERTTGYGRTRKGLVCAIDLDSYEWKSGNKALIRATEATIVERIPPRKKIRDGAPLESPHIMLLVNDPNRLLVEACGKRAKKSKPVYDDDLMLSSGHITGWAVKNQSDVDALHDSLCALKKQNVQGDGSVFLFAVGDGNHSLATAKAVWDEYKTKKLAQGATEASLAECPVRYALVEIVNIYDEGLTFEPIHRVLFDASADALVSFFNRELNASASTLNSEKELEDAVKKSSSDFGIVYTENSSSKYVLLKTDVRELLVSRMQPLLDSFIKESGASIDYIHGSDEVFRLGKKENALSILLPPVDKASFFTTIAKSGSLPRKSFSMGEASEKRFYLECRKLFAGEN